MAPRRAELCLESGGLFHRLCLVDKRSVPAIYVRRLRPGVARQSVSRAEQEVLTRQIRETGAKAPVVDAADLPDDFVSFEKAVGKIAANPISVSSAKLPKKQERTDRFVVLSAS
jgi:hypothetical protein